MGGWAGTFFFSAFGKWTLDTMLVSLTVITSCTREYKPSDPDKTVRLSCPPYRRIAAEGRQ